ncbi:alpha-beta hydrolase superfamily lysophospholipase [Tamaricihabitans halophyticus]|uniref:Alpha-beta hydrolase superfamily lysophospholipase n=1 Tax=Tamaricihabitans halophyticus TaxID=1262583 RepID=A0A4R2QKI7_9PSEU|nr:alpha/beta hydrolase [Tamaricihabitans halophyticus]TCP49264.1 alpha-beta hydrolase superfamily lysophospholipase [Tamaricihabitans halophyticus]
MTSDYLRFLPADALPNPLPEPTSTSWHWRDMRAHVLRAGDPAAPCQAILLHGAGGHAGALWPAAAILAGAGFRVAMPDLPGFGRTSVPDRGALRYPDWTAFATDFVRAEQRSGTPMLVVGASMGGMLAYEAACRTGAVHTVLATCLLDPRGREVHARIARFPVLGRYAGPLLRLLAGPLAAAQIPLRALVKMRAISNDRGLVDTVVADKLGGGNAMPLGFLRSYLDSKPAVEPEQATGTRFVLAHPTEDHWTPLELSTSFLDRINGKTELVLLEGTGHFPIESPGIYQLRDTIRRLFADMTPSSKS